MVQYIGFNVIPFTSEAAARIFDKAKEEIKIIVPDDKIDFCYNSQLVHALDRAIAERGVVVKIACVSFAPDKGIFGLKSARFLKLKRPYKRLLVVVDQKHVIEERTPKVRKIEIGIISLDCKSTLGHEVDSIFDELTA